MVRQSAQRTVPIYAMLFRDCRGEKVRFGVDWKLLVIDIYSGAYLSAGRGDTYLPVARAYRWEFQVVRDGICCVDAGDVSGGRGR